MPQLQKPTEPEIRAFLAAQSERPYSYPQVGDSRHGSPAGYDVDHNRAELGRGRAAFEAACAALSRWRMFPHDWAAIYPPQTPIESQRVVALVIRAWGMWWLNAARIVYVIDESQPVHRFGFAYGTLQGHVESGEERFLVEWDAEDRVWYDLRAFSRPRHWLVRLGYPFARRLQKRFVAQSQAAMQRAVTDALATVNRLQDPANACSTTADA